ncbi:hypothetical protein GE061_016646 [Apolygus lucorum]|uniref:Uncharacterized protein n=1 Tax=Apolygus lucorum TaxID=248454 RepID=A0A6A4INT5_APOLU|nr:hypothetical protein GE061_016646 [Apolygus lucorum]
MSGRGRRRRGRRAEKDSPFVAPLWRGTLALTNWPRRFGREFTLSKNRPYSTKKKKRKINQALMTLFPPICLTDTSYKIHLSH